MRGKHIDGHTKEHTRRLNLIQARRDRAIKRARSIYDRDTNEEIERWLTLRYGSIRQVCEVTET